MDSYHHAYASVTPHLVCVPLVNQVLLSLGAVEDLSRVRAHEGVEEGVEPALPVHLAGLRPQDSAKSLSLLSPSTCEEIGLDWKDEGKR